MTEYHRRCVTGMNDLTNVREVIGKSYAPHCLAIGVAAVPTQRQRVTRPTTMRQIAHESPPNSSGAPEAVHEKNGRRKFWPFGGNRLDEYVSDPSLHVRMRVSRTNEKAFHFGRPFHEPEG